MSYKLKYMRKLNFHFFLLIFGKYHLKKNPKTMLYTTFY